MTTLTVNDAASRLGVKPAKVREFINDRKLSARPSPPTAIGRTRDRLLLDAAEVDALASVRAHKRRQREDPSAGTARLPNGTAEEALIGEIQSAAVPIDSAGPRLAALLQSVLAPLAAELHDARETIRRQAEELGSLRATVAEFQRRDSAAAIPELAAAGPASERLAGTDSFRRPARNGHSGRDTIPVWRRALAHIIPGTADVV